MKDDFLKDALLKGKYVSPSDIEKAENYAKTHGTSFSDYLFNEELLNAALLGQAVAEKLGVEYHDLESSPPSAEELALIPNAEQSSLRAVPVLEEDGVLVVATDSEDIDKTKTEVGKYITGKKLELRYSLTRDIDAVLDGNKPKLATRFEDVLKKQTKVAPEIVDMILEDAIGLHASDVHIEPRDKEVLIRFRVDGVLHDAGRLPKEWYENVTNRIKVQARLRIDEHFSSQDGAIRFAVQGRTDPVDLRVSIVPTLDGEKVVIRILSSYVRDLTLANVGLSERLQKRLLESVKKPFGMILVTGPTGSGKTTTLYSLIKVMNTRETNITTIEDPVEYKIQGINQIQANTQTNLTFAKGLRAIARQDPNIVLVGEIRDLETADIAVNAALTGHLLLSTFHANNAATAIPRFIDMGVEPFLVASTLELVIAQRLVRKICESCKVSYTLSPADLDQVSLGLRTYFSGKSITLYKGKGCPACSQTGFKGRLGVFEFLGNSPELQDLIGKSPSTKDVADLAKQQGFQSMFEDGVEKVKSGLTSIEELLRVVAP